jgi:hypothetical protein
MKEAENNRPRGTYLSLAIAERESRRSDAGYSGEIARNRSL